MSGKKKGGRFRFFGLFSGDGKVDRERGGESRNPESGIYLFMEDSRNSGIRIVSTSGIHSRFLYVQAQIVYMRKPGVRGAQFASGKPFASV